MELEPKCQALTLAPDPGICSVWLQLHVGRIFFPMGRVLVDFSRVRRY